MPVTIGSNIASLKAQRQLSSSSDKLSASFERLSSGQRINKASDDAAGLAIADSLAAKTRVYTQGIRNINDGISLTNIAQGAVSSLSDIVTRQKELSEQAANGTYASKQRAALNEESFALPKEYNRIIQSTTFNGVQIIGGSNTSVRIQHGIGLAESTSVQLGQAIGQAVGDGTFGAQLSYLGSDERSLTTADLNGDGNLDLLSVDNSGNYAIVRLGNGDATFGARTTFATGSNPFSIATADFDGDGKTDIISADTGSNQVTVRLGHGDGTFGAAVTYATGGGPNSVVVGDFNGDGKADFISADSSSNQVTIRLGNGNGTFSASSTYATGSLPYSITTGDFNEDGKLDFITAEVSSNQVSIRLGNGDGTFGSLTSYPSGFAPSSVATGDFNGDGKLDILVGESSSAQVSIRFGNGDGTFGAKTNYATGGSPANVKVGDFNGDRNLDFLSADDSSAQISVRLNNGDGTFGAQTTYVTGPNPASATVGDFNGDGILDFASTDRSSPQLSVRLGNANTNGRRNNLQTALDLTTAQGARTALDKTTTLLENISKELGNIGVVQSRLQTSASNLDTRAENYKAAQSRIVDTDIAQETTELVRGQILQQVGAAVLSQANLQPNIALKLLQN